MKVQQKDLGEKEIIATLDVLYTAAGSLKGRDAMKRFLRDLLTPSERIMLGRRIIIARRLVEGRSHRAISSELRVGADTVWKVHRWLLDSMPGYEDALEGMEREFEKRGRRAMQKALWGNLKRKYPLHFLLFTLHDHFVARSARKRSSPHA